MSGGPKPVLADERAAAAGLLRLFSRARRGRKPMVLVRLRCRPLPGMARVSSHRLALQIAARLRIGDLLWWQPRMRVLWLLLEETDDAAPVLRRLQHLGGQGWRLEASLAHFPAQGLTLESLRQQLAHPGRAARAGGKEAA